MHYLITVYSQNAFAEYILPSLSDDTYKIFIDRKKFRITSDIVLVFEAVNSEWSILNDGNIIPLPESQKLEKYPVSDCSFVYRIVKETILFIHCSIYNNAAVPYTKINTANTSRISIGCSSDCSLQYSFNNVITANHAFIDYSGDGAVLRDNSRNGVFLNGLRVKNESRLAFGDIITIYGLTIVYLKACIAVSSANNSLKINIDKNAIQKLQYSAPSNAVEIETHTYFKRSPRVLGGMFTDPFEIEAPPAPQRIRKQPLLLAIGPSFTMVIPMLLGTTISLTTRGSGSIIGIIVSGTAGIIAAVWAIVRLKNSKKSAEEDEKLRREQYELYIKKNEDELSKQSVHNTGIMLDRYPCAADCAKMSINRLWNRNTSHRDMLFVRLGLGDSPFQVPIIIPKERFSLVNDPLAEYPQKLKDKYEFLHDVPVGVDLLDKKLLGILSPGGVDDVMDVVRSMIVQIAANTCYTDVKLVFFYDESSQSQWQFARWLPHVKSSDGKIRYIASNKSDAADIIYTLSAIFRDRSENTANDVRFMPHYIIFVADRSLVEGSTLSGYLTSDNQIDVTVVYLSDSYENLPNECTEIIEYSNTFHGIYNVNMMEEDRIAVDFDKTSISQADSFARSLSGFKVRDNGSGGEIPNSITFFEMHGISSPSEINLLERWRKAKTYDTLRALIGVKADNVPVYLDVHEKYHGPHGMIAGTTGSGKSETIQTYMLSIAMNYSPLDVGFLVIDYKGGGMANLFDGLPHMLGTISNLSGNQIHRALTSIKSEIRRRQRIFAQYDVNHIDKYTHLFKNKETNIPIPHLLIIIDEFAELKREQPEFMSELISVAQVGRSLGIHLILATQKPSNAVDDNIWSNSKFKICLRVQDKQDSNDMIKKPDAAFITQTGRGYLQVGNDEIFELFQSGWSGAIYDESAGHQSESAFLITPTGRMIAGKRKRMLLKEKQRVEWIKLLVQIAEKYADQSLSDDDMLAEIYAELNRLGIDYQRNYSNDTKLKYVLELFREYKLSSTDLSAAEYVMMHAKAESLPEQKEKTQLTAVIEYIAAVAAENNIKNTVSLWRPLLKDVYSLEEINDADVFNGKEWPVSDGTVSAVIGYGDNPSNQDQFPVSVSFSENGHFAVCGNVLSGKSTLMQTLLYSLCLKYRPDMLNFYILDFSNKMLLPFERIPHTGAFLSEDDGDKISKLFVMLKKELESRKKQLRGSNFSQLLKSGDAKMPALILAIDGYSSFREKTSDAFEQQIIEISREGAACGIYLAIASNAFGTNDIRARISDNIKSVITLAMGDKFKYTDTLHTTKLDILPEEGIKGRGLTAHNGGFIEFQTAVASVGNDYERTQAIEEVFEQIAQNWEGSFAKGIPVIPDKPLFSDLISNHDYADALNSSSLVPVGYRKRDAELFCLDLNDIFSYLVIGKPKCGMTNFQKVFAASAARKGAEVYCIIPEGAEFSHADSDRLHICSSLSEIEKIGNEMLPGLRERSAYKAELLADDLNPDEVKQAMMQKFKPMFLFIDNLAEFIEMLYKKQQDATIKGFFENIVDKGEMFNLYIVATIASSDISSVRGYKFADLICSHQDGMLIGGKATDQRLFDFKGLSYAERDTVLKVGHGISTKQSGDVEGVVIPLYTRR